MKSHCPYSGNDFSSWNSILKTSTYPYILYLISFLFDVIFLNIALCLTVEVALADNVLFVVSMLAFAKPEFDLEVPTLEVRAKRHERVAFFADFADKLRDFAFVQ